MKYYLEKTKNYLKGQFVKSSIWINKLLINRVVFIYTVATVNVVIRQFFYSLVPMYGL